MTDGRSLDDLGRAVDRHDVDLREIRERYVTEKVFLALEKRVERMEQSASTTWLSNRNALLAFASVIIGIVVSAYIATKGGGH